MRDRGPRRHKAAEEIRILLEQYIRATPDGFGGTVSFDCTVSDGRGGTLSATVTIVATCRYSGASDGSFVAMVVQDQTARSLAQPTPNQGVKPGEGEVTLSATITIPAEASSVEVYLGLSAPGLIPSTSVVKATFEVR